MESLGTLAGCLLMSVAAIATAGLFARFNAFYRQELARTSQRETALDGLRGFAALMVAVHHAAIYRWWLATGEWGNAGALLPQLFGPIAVILFFMLTGYLFWGQARSAKGWMNPWRLWRGRFFRIAPLYLFSLVLVAAAVCLDTGTAWLSPANWKSLLRLLGLGAWEWHAIGRVYPGEYISNVVWTLWYEWRFYLILPLIAWLAADRRVLGMRLSLLVLPVAGFWLDLAAPVAVYFVFGMLSSELLQFPVICKSLKLPAAAAAALMIGAGLYCVFQNLLPATGPSDCLALACLPVFLTAAAGNTFFGVLVHPAARCLGAVSFSLYLLHGVLFSLAGIVLKQMNVAHLTEFQFWLLFTPLSAALICLCLATYRWIEFPFLSSSHRKRVANAMKN